MFLLYQEYLSTHPWDFLLAAAVIIVALGVPIVVTLGLKIQERRSEEERPLPWLEVIARPRDDHSSPDRPSAAPGSSDGAAPGNQTPVKEQPHQPS